MKPYQKLAIESIQRPSPWFPLGQFFVHDAPPMTKIMTRAETISRRFEAMRMRWPGKAMILSQQELQTLSFSAMRGFMNRMVFRSGREGL